MKVSPDELKSRMDRFEKVLKGAGIRLTHQRKEIFREVARTGDHPDVERIYRIVRRRIPVVSLDTIYRTLWLLVDLGLITTLGPSRERTRFDANMRSHHHFVCSRCSMTRDFYNSEFDRLKVPADVRVLGNTEKTQVVIKGTCTRCLKEMAGSQ